ncbi:TonB-dependent receptor domain-containing protein [Sphingomonas phyllosphaerae]|uniref:TonB-dependent receptor domain-containing protein n=1 Tax=Sphingomonas phyllosphaerae TaxID=257003 RepID=UPI0003B737C4|nr:TonB-dependent receptor [Sphingomonas phyllosphaerae]
MLNAYRSRLLTSTLLVAAATIAAPALAQTADPASQPKTGVQSTDPAAPAAGVSSQEAAPPAGETSTGDVVVTGTLIRNPNLIASSPVAVIGQEEIQLRQRNTAEELLRDLPGAVPSIGAQVNNGNGGSSFADLRGLGNFRNVVLIDGNRIAPSSVVGRVDLNNIPLALVERVDVLTGGAATTYGADAVSGVMNFITRSDFSGMELNVSEGITERGDGEQTRVDLTVGANFDDGRGNAVLSLGYQNADPVYQGARDFSRNNYTSTSGGVGGSGTTVPTRFTLAGLAGTGNPGFQSGNVQINPTTGALQTPVVPFNFNPYNVFQTPFERFNIYGAGHYDVSDSVQVYTRGMFSKNTVSTIIAPSGVFGTSLAIPFSNPYLPAAARGQFCANNPTFTAAGVRVGQLSAAECAAAAAATDPNDPNFRYFTAVTNRRTTEVGARVSDYVTTLFDYRAGVKVGISDHMNLDVNGSYGESENTQTIRNYVLTSRVRSAVFATNTTSCLGGAPGGAAVDAGTGCIPINIFGPEGSINGNQIGYLTANSTSSNRTTLAQARALLSGDLGFSSPFADEPIGFALGTEYRKYTAGQDSDILAQQAGELGGAGGAAPTFTGGYNVVEGYGEVILPLVSDKPFFRSLTAEGGLRYSSYKVDAPGKPSYDTWTYKAGGSWEPAAGVKVRGNYQRAVRAPNIGELFTPVSTALTNLSYDACAGAAPTTNANLRSVCLAQGAPAASIGSIEVPTAGQANFTAGGNLGLRPEKSDSYTIGVVLQPDFVPGFTISVDYYNISIEDAISQLTAGSAYNLCFGDRAGTGVTATSAASVACQNIRRNPDTGALDGDPATTQGLIITPSNSGRILTDGIDLNVNYRRDLGVAKLNLSFNGNWTNRSKFEAAPGSGILSCVGLYGQNCGSPGSAGPSSSAGSLQPAFTWTQRTTVTVQAVDLSLLWRHVGAMEVEDGVTTFNGTLESGSLAGQSYNFGKINAYNYFDLATRFGVSDNFDMTVTVTNLFDRQPPIVGGTIGSTSFNSGNTYPSTYDTLGRRFVVGARIKF